MTSRCRHNMMGYAFIAPYFLLFTTFVLLPLVFGIGLSMMRWEMLSQRAPEFVAMGNFTEALADPYFWKAMGVTTLFVVLCVPLTIALALGLALGIGSMRRGGAICRAAVLMPMMVNITVIGILWRWLLSTDFGVFNGYLGRIGIEIPWTGEPGWAMASIVLMTLWWGVGAPTVILLAGLKQIPSQFAEAAQIDGANAVQQLWLVTLPMLKPVMIFVLVMQIIASFQIFGQAYFVTEGGPNLSTRVMMQYIYETAFMHYRMGYGAAMSWLLFLVIAVVSLVQYRMAREA